MGKVGVVDVEERKAPDPQGSGRGLPLVPRPQGLPGYRPHDRLAAECFSAMSHLMRGRTEDPVASCELRADVALGRPWASPSCRRDVRFTAFGALSQLALSPYPPVQDIESNRRANIRQWLKNAVLRAPSGCKGVLKRVNRVTAAVRNTPANAA